MALDFKSINWAALLKKLSNPKAADDLNHFLEKLPHNAGQTVLIAAGIAWGMAGALGLYTTLQIQSLTQLRTELKEEKALVPIVPKIKDVAISAEEVKKFSEKAQKFYKGLSIKDNKSSVIVTSKNTSNFGEFREAIGHIQSGGEGWRVSLEKLCVGRECDKQAKLAAALTINKVSVENPSK